LKPRHLLRIVLVLAALTMIYGLRTQSQMRNVGERYGQVIVGQTTEAQLKTLMDDFEVTVVTPTDPTEFDQRWLANPNLGRVAPSAMAFNLKGGVVILKEVVPVESVPKPTSR